MSSEIPELLRSVVARLRAKALFGQPGDSVSMRIPGRSELLVALPESNELRLSRFDQEGDEAAGVHSAVYRARKDAGAVLIGTTAWSAATVSLQTAVPILFDEQARHIGKIGEPVAFGRPKHAIEGLRRGGNVVVYGDQRICIGTTANRVVFNADLFEKCCKAFVVAHATGERLHEVPVWVRYIAARRLRADQKRAAASYERGSIPEGMDAY